MVSGEMVTRASVVIVGGFLFGACVGDSTLADGGADATSDTAAPDVAVDSAKTDGGVDAATTCDVTKAFATPVLVTSLASGSASNLRFDQNLTTAFFNSTRDGGLGGADIWQATHTDAGVFGALTDVPIVNTTGEDDYPTISGDGKTLVFASDRGGGADDIWVATRTSTLVNFGAPSLLANVNSASSENAPFLREDGQKLYFASDRSPGAGTDDIWVSSVSGSSFSAPTHIDELATASSDAYAVVTPDDLVIYFASNRAGGAGGRDVWVATRKTSGDVFSAPTVVAELNTTFEDLPSYITADRCTIYFSANITGTYEVYVATKTP